MSIFNTFCVHCISLIIFVGDFNVNMLSNSSSCNHLNDIMHSFSLLQVVTEPTRIRNDDSSSLIDLVLMSSPENLIECETIPPLVNSDHLGISKIHQEYSLHVARKEQSGGTHTLTFRLHVCF